MAVSFLQRGSLLLRKSRRKDFVVASPRNPLRALALVVLEHMMTQLVQENLLQHESPKRVLRPIHERRADILQQGQHRSGALQPTDNINLQQSRQSPGRHRLLEENDSARHAISAVNTGIPALLAS